MPQGGIESANWHKYVTSVWRERIDACPWRITKWGGKTALLRYYGPGRGRLVR
jgi:hypothetical protein